MAANNVKINYINGEKASEDIFKSTIDKMSPDILHFATHGFFFPDPYRKGEKQKDTGSEDRSTMIGVRTFVRNDNPLFRSGLVLAGANDVWSQEMKGEKEDGVLTAYEVSNLNMQNTKLVAMSACETGLGDIRGSEGVYGLQRAFKMAGVDFLIMSLWQIPDRETVEFMTIFYEQFFKQKDIRKAFITAQSQMREKYDPYYWAAFVLVE